MTALDALWAVRFRLTLIPKTPLVLPFFSRGAILRGAFGLAFRRLVCHDVSAPCRICALYTSCAYPEVFEPAPPENSDRLSTFSDLPRPFVVETPRDARATFAPGERVVFGLTVFGKASRFSPYFVAAFRNLAEEGLGPRRARFSLTEVAAMGPDNTVTHLYEADTPALSIEAPPVHPSDFMRPGDDSLTSLTVNFTTPTELKDRGSVATRPEFGPLVRRLRDRLSSLAAFFGDGPLALDFKGISTLADAVQLVENKTRRVEVARRSSKTGRRHDIGGFVGEATYQGSAIGALMPLLRAGELAHVGRHAAFGNGRITIESSPRTGRGD